MIKFQLFRRFTNSDEIYEVCEMLSTHKIEFKASNPTSRLGSSFGSSSYAYYELSVQPTDFEKVELLLEERAESVIQNISPNYHLFTFSDSELRNILSNPGDWNEIDVKLSAKILNDRSKNTTSKPTNIEKVSIPEESKKSATDKDQRVKKHFLIELSKDYALLIFSIFLGASFAFYVINYQPPGVDTDHVAIAIAVLIMINVLYYESKYTCPKCKERSNTERLHKFEQGDVLMPSPYNVLERYKCYNCGHVWDEYSEERSGD